MRVGRRLDAEDVRAIGHEGQDTAGHGGLRKAYFRAGLDDEILEVSVPTIASRDIFCQPARFKDRLATYGFTEGVDFVTFQAGRRNGQAGNRGIRTQYVITIDTAKELSMVERNDRGREARR